jgi:hypothetical protein
MTHSFLATHSIRAALAAAVGLAGLGMSTAAAGAQPAKMPSYASGEEVIRGRIASIDGKYELRVRDERGFVDRVTLHDGTVINPTGLRLSPGQSVTIMGHSAGKSFAANEIDTPYAQYGIPAYGYDYGYPPYGYGYYPYPYGPYPAFGPRFRDRGFGVRGWF